MATGPKQWLEAMTRVKQAADLHSSLPMQAVLLHLLKHPQFPCHIERLCGLYGERYRLLAAALHNRLGDVCSFDPVEGGMFIWLRLPPCDPMAVARAALSQGVAVVPGTVFYTGGQTPPGKSRTPTDYSAYLVGVPDLLRLGRKTRYAGVVAYEIGYCLKKYS